MKLENVHRTFQVGEVAVHVLRGVDLDLYAGELLIIQGESGSGKTTLMNMIGGIDQPSQGTISFEGEEISKLINKILHKPTVNLKKKTQSQEGHIYLKAIRHLFHLDG